MQQRRLGPGDVLDDYCPRERRVTDHAIVAMIDDTIQQTRCVVCDAEHEYKQAKVPPQRKKKAPALFNQVLDGLKAPARPPHVPESATDEPEVIQQHEPVAVAAVEDVPVAAVAAVAAVAVQPIESEVVVAAAAVMAVADPDDDAQPTEPVEGPLFRRQLIRAALPRPEGTTPPARVIPEFTIRQPMGRNRHGGGGGGRRRAGGQGQGQGFNGPMRFGRSDGFGQRSNGHGRPGGGNGRSGGQGGHGGHGNHGGPNPSGGSGRGGNRGRGPRRGGKKR
jgi:hypothetical protein